MIKVAALNAGLRGTGLVGRFALSLFMARYMTFEDIGIFALLTGVAGLLPAVSGFGLNYFMSRELVVLDHDAAVHLVRDRLLATFVAAAVSVAVMLALAASGWIDLPLPPLLVGAIIALELVAFDVQMAHQARRRPIFANINLTVRSSLWIPPFVVLAFFLPQLRTIEVVGWFWLGGLVCAYIVLVWAHHRDIGGAIRGAQLRRNRLLGMVRHRFLPIYISDLGIAGSVYVDRFYITAIAGVREAGVYFFFASLANGIYVLCSASTVQIFGPQLRALYREGGYAALADGLRSRVRSTVLTSTAFILAAIPLIWVMLQITGKPELKSAFEIVPVLLLGYGFKILSDLYGTLFAATERDRYYVGFNILMLLATVAFGVVLVSMMGYRGAALAMLLASAFVMTLKIYTWRRTGGPLSRKGLSS